jgi:F0F1-type ATP synthase membrane subunit b/b'
MDEKRRAALAMRADVVAETRREIERSTSEATAKIRAQADQARASLDGEADQLASTIVERVLGRTLS